MNKIRFVRPVKTTSISLTGKDCALNCPYCNKHYLSHMKDISDIDSGKFSSILVSGGMTEKGCVPFSDFHQELSELKKKGMRLNIHSGIIREDSDYGILRSLADCVSFDFLIQESTIKRIYGDFFSASDFIYTFEKLKKNDIKVVPHVMIGIDRGRISGEFDCIDFLAGRTDEIVFLVLVVNRNTEYRDLTSPDIDDVVKVLDYAVKRIENVSLGCMRPGGKYRSELDLKALRLGVKKIVMPSREAVRYAETNDFLIENGEECCVF